MDSQSTTSAENRAVDAQLKEQNEGIFTAFSLEEHNVLTTSEIADHVDIKKRQVRRRLNDLEDEGIVDSRKPGRTKLWWLQEEVEEPLSVRYPAIGEVKERLSLQLLLMGVLFGISSVLLTTGFLLSSYYEVPVPLLTSQSIIQSGLLSSMIAAGLFMAASIIAGLDWLLGHLEIEI